MPLIPRPTREAFDRIIYDEFNARLKRRPAISEELKETPKVIATGGLAGQFVNHSKYIDSAESGKVGYISFATLSANSIPYLITSLMSF